jgi:hypothetical protein
VKLLLTSSGISNPSIEDALVGLLGKPIAESSALIIPTAIYRLQAIETLLAQGLGRPGQAEEQPAPRLPTSVAAVQTMGWEEMQAVLVATYADEIAAAQLHGGRAVVREKLVALSTGERRVLRQALDELGSV